MTEALTPQLSLLNSRFNVELGGELQPWTGTATRVPEGYDLYDRRHAARDAVVQVVSDPMKVNAADTG
jgi:hypothetical protein